MSPPGRRFTLARVAWGALFLQAGFSAERRQGLGFGAALSPLASLFPDRDAKARFLRRETESYNTNPAFAGIVLGVTARLEEQGAAGDATAVERVPRVKRALEAPFAAAGDRLLWGGLRPAGAMWGGAAATFIGLWGAVIFLAVYNLFHLGFRIGGVFWGYRAGEGASRLLRRPLVRGLIAAVPWLVVTGAAALGGSVFIGEGGAGGLGVASALLGLVLGRRGFARGTLLAVGGIIVGYFIAFFLGPWIP